mgnify:CR=1 FL=1
MKNIQYVKLNIVKYGKNMQTKNGMIFYVLYIIICPYIFSILIFTSRQWYKMIKGKLFLKSFDTIQERDGMVG